MNIKPHAPIKKRILAGVVLIVIILFISFTVPLAVKAQSENATWVASDNFTITIEDFSTALTDATQVIADNQTTLFQNAVGLVLIMGITALAYWRRLTLLYALSGLSLLIYGFGYFTTSLSMSIILVVLAISSFAMAAWDRAKR